MPATGADSGTVREVAVGGIVPECASAARFGVIRKGGCSRTDRQ